MATGTLFTRTFNECTDFDEGRRMICAYVKTVDNGTKDARVPVPFKGKLVGGIAVEQTACTNSKAVHIDVEKTAASGTQLMLLSVASTSVSGAIGTVTTGVVDASAADSALIVDCNYVNLETTGASGAAAGAWNVYLFFETGEITAAGG